MNTGFERIQFVHNALPEINYRDIDTRTIFLGKELQAPFIISSMTGGTNRGREFNYRLAKAAQKEGIGMGLGSMRILLEDPSALKSFSVRHIAPDILLMANLGAIQLNYGVTPKDCQYLVNSVKADALILHLNPLQEGSQPEGNMDWGNLLPKIKKVANHISVPIVVKEVGHGISQKNAEDLIAAGVAVIDTAGAGGTSWSQVESYRSSNELQKRLAQSFIEWGTPTLACVRMVRAASKTIPIIASGGLTSGIDGAKAIRSGANIFGLAHTFLKAADTSEESITNEIKLIKNQLKLSMLCTGSRCIKDLETAEILEKK